MTLVNNYVQIMFSTYRNCTCPCAITSYNRFCNRVSSHSRTSEKLGEDSVSNFQSLIFLPKLFFIVIFICL